MGFFIELKILDDSCSPHSCAFYEMDFQSKLHISFVYFVLFFINKDVFGYELCKLCMINNSDLTDVYIDLSRTDTKKSCYDEIAPNVDNLLGRVFDSIGTLACHHTSRGILLVKP